MQNADIQQRYVQEQYRNEDIARLETYLTEAGTFEFTCLENGLFPAVGQAEEDDISGYQHAWVRDNVHIAYAHFVWGATQTALTTADALMKFFATQQDRIRQVINDPSLAEDPMNRPHIRFNGQTLEMLEEKWAHAQNDALGYFIWFYCKTAAQRPAGINDSSLETLALLAVYLQAISYWEDCDSGHWEEYRRIGASSIGAVVAGLRQMRKLCSDQGLYERQPLSNHGVNEQFLNNLETKGTEALNKILPYESRGAETKRRYDAALLFLIYPLEVVSQDQAVQILTDVKSALQGEIGIRRYLKDSYWCPDYRELFIKGVRSTDFSNNLLHRDKYHQEGMKAQWCIFDSIISCIHGMRVLHRKGGTEEWNEQIRYLNRSLGQLTAKKNTGILSTLFGWLKPKKQKEDSGLLCPESYFYEKGRLVPNDHVPLQWAQANLKLALYWLTKSVQVGT
ncbi:glycoside hydrolase family 15 protein [Candidatus Electrothrix sp.]|uniref:glycoside hydrolase family 15 protein n=1 Tax=Candidatus Electrothrix sp. TaxID=2170559 RepID=UPI004057459C